MIKKVLIVLLLAAVLLGGISFIIQKDKLNIFKKDTESSEEKKSPEKPKETEAPKPKEPEFVIKDTALIEIPYTVQAPFADWTVHQESCEEAVALMLNHFLKGENKFDGASTIPQRYAYDEMVKMIDWQKKNYGKEPDLTVEDWGKFVKGYYGYNYQTFLGITKDDIKGEISKGNPVVVPVMTHSLKNPYYGPETSYHVLIIKGYNPEGVITNDPGVKEGESYFYTWDILFSAIDAQTQKMGQGRDMVILKK